MQLHEYPCPVWPKALGLGVGTRTIDVGKAALGTQRTEVTLMDRTQDVASWYWSVTLYKKIECRLALWRRSIIGNHYQAFLGVVGVSNARYSVILELYSLSRAEPR